MLVQSDLSLAIEEFARTADEAIMKAREVVLPPPWSGHSRPVGSRRKMLESSPDRFRRDARKKTRTRCTSMSFV